MNIFLKSSILAALASAIGSSAYATTVVFPDPGPGNYNFSPASSYDGVTFSGTNLAISGVGTSIGANQVNLFSDSFGGFIDVIFAPTTSFSAMLAQGYNGTSGPLSVNVFDGAFFVESVVVTVGGQDSFTPFSLSGIGTFTEVDFSTAGFPQFPGIAQVTVGGVPETSTWALMLLGFGAVGVAARRKTAIA